MSNPFHEYCPKCDKFHPAGDCPKKCQADNYERGGDPFDAPICGTRASFFKKATDPRLKGVFLCARHAKQKRWNKGTSPAPLNP